VAEVTSIPGSYRFARMELPDGTVQHPPQVNMDLFCKVPETINSFPHGSDT